MKLAVRDYDRDVKIVMYREKEKWSFIKIGKKLGVTKGRARVLYVRIIEEREQTIKQMGIGA
jgi:hypothetical protein